MATSCSAVSLSRTEDSFQDEKAPDRTGKTANEHDPPALLEDGQYGSKECQGSDKFIHEPSSEKDDENTSHSSNQASSSRISAKSTPDSSQDTNAVGPTSKMADEHHRSDLIQDEQYGSKEPEGSEKAFQAELCGKDSANDGQSSIHFTHSTISGKGTSNSSQEITESAENNEIWDELHPRDILEEGQYRNQGSFDRASQNSAFDKSSNGDKSKNLAFSYPQQGDADYDVTFLCTTALESSSEAINDLKASRDSNAKNRTSLGSYLNIEKYHLIFLVIIVASFISVFAISIVMGRKEENEGDNYFPKYEFNADDPIVQLEKMFKELQQRFPNQTSRYWKVIRVAVKTLYRSSVPPKPAVVLLVGTQSTWLVTDCIACQIAAGINKVTLMKGVIELDGSDVVAVNDQDAKLMIDERLSTGFAGDSRVAILKHLEKFGKEPLLLMHAYCDHENAAFKDVALIITLRLDVTYPDRDKMNEIIEYYLKELWDQKLGIDEAAALRSRIANNIAVTNYEQSDVMETFCQ